MSRDSKCNLEQEEVTPKSALQLDKARMDFILLTIVQILEVYECRKKEVNLVQGNKARENRRTSAGESLLL